MGLALVIVAGAAFAARPDYYPEMPRALLFVPMAVVGGATLFWLVRTLFIGRGRPMRTAKAN